MPPRIAPVESCLALVRILRSLRSRSSSLTLPSSRYRRKINLTSSASSSTMAILPSFISYPRGRVPPTQRPFRLEAAILSRMRSEVTSRSNWAKDKSTLSVSRPIDVVVLNCWVTETNETPWVSNSSTSLAKSAIDLVDDNDVNLSGADIVQQLLKIGTIGRPAGVSPVVIAGPDQGPAGMGLAFDVGLGGL